jgi:hypothetical protein
MLIAHVLRTLVAGLFGAAALAAPALAQKPGTISKNNFTAGPCQIASMDVKYRIGAFFGEPVYSGAYQWTTSDGNEECLSGDTKVALEVNDGVGYIILNPTVQRSGQPYGFDVGGSPNWNDFICDADGSNCMTEANARATMNAGYRITDFIVTTRGNARRETPAEVAAGEDADAEQCEPKFVEQRYGSSAVYQCYDCTELVDSRWHGLFSGDVELDDYGKKQRAKMFEECGIPVDQIRSSSLEETLQEAIDDGDALDEENEENEETAEPETDELETALRDVDENLERQWAEQKQKTKTKVVAEQTRPSTTKTKAKQNQASKTAAQTAAAGCYAFFAIRCQPYNSPGFLGFLYYSDVFRIDGNCPNGRQLAHNLRTDIDTSVHIKHHNANGKQIDWKFYRNSAYPKSGYNKNAMSFFLSLSRHYKRRKNWPKSCDYYAPDLEGYFGPYVRVEKFLSGWRNEDNSGTYRFGGCLNKSVPGANIVKKCR